MQLALCNEVLKDMPFAEQCAFAAAVGYDGLEIAPFTLGEEPHLLPPARRAEIRRIAADAGLAVVGLHWLLLAPRGLSITSADAALRTKTIEVMRRLIGLCADLGGRIMVHGSPQQRQLPEGPEAEAARAHGCEAFAAVAGEAEAAGIAYCIEPLAPQETNFINSLAEAAEIVRAIGSPAIRTMVDTSAAGATEAQPVADLLDQWLPTGLVAHVQVNDTNRRGPGQGRDRFAPVFAALGRHGYDGAVSVEPFDYHPDGPAAAARAIGYLRGILEARACKD